MPKNMSPLVRVIVYHQLNEVKGKEMIYSPATIYDDMKKWYFCFHISCKKVKLK